MSTLEKNLTDKLGQVKLWPLPTGGNKVNVGEGERVASMVVGGYLTLYGLTRFSKGGLVLGAVGADLLYRGFTGHSLAYDLLDLNTADKLSSPAATVKASRSVKVKRAMTIEKPPAELYRYWRNFENLPAFMEHLESVRVTGANTSHWVAKGPVGTKAEWDAEIYNEKENELIAWRSLPGSMVSNAGTVQFKPAPGNRGTELKVEIDYEPPAGRAGDIIAGIFGEAPVQQVQEDLRHFKQMMEAGEIPTTKGQPTCRDNK